MLCVITERMQEAVNINAMLSRRDSTERPISVRLIIQKSALLLAIIRRHIASDLINSIR